MPFLSRTRGFGNPVGPTLPGSQCILQWQLHQKPYITARVQPSPFGSSLLPGPIACDGHLRSLKAKMMTCHLERENCLVQDACLSHRDNPWDSLLGHQTHGTPELLTQLSVCSAHIHSSVGSTNTPRDGLQNRQIQQVLLTSEESHQSRGIFAFTIFKVKIIIGSLCITNVISIRLFLN